MRKVILFIWKKMDPLYYSLTRLKYINYGENIFRVRLTTYKGYPITLSDGTEIRKNDLLLKIHIHNIKLIQELIDIKDDFQKAKVFYHTIKKSLPDLAKYLYFHPKRQNIKAIIGISSLHIGRKNQLGFEYFDIKNQIYKQFKRWAHWPISYLAIGKLASRSADPRYIFIPSKILIQKYYTTPLLQVIQENEPTSQQELFI